MYKVDVPPGVSGKWRVEKFTVTPEDEKFERLRASINPQRGGRFVPAGEYTRLMRNSTLVMSDTPDEIEDNRAIIQQSCGDVLINGLGLGVVVQAVCLKRQVRHVTVIEIAPEVIELVGKHWLARFGHKLSIIQADAFTWEPPKSQRYSAVWHDIWDNICTDNLPEMTKLHRKYARRTDWQGSWCKWQCQRARY